MADGMLHWGGKDNSSFKRLSKTLYKPSGDEEFLVIEPKTEAYFDVVHGWCRY